MGMSRAFLVAGSRSVLVSLWSVDSKATEQMMVAFYRHLRAGTPAPDALRKAKLELIEAYRTGGDARRNLLLQARPGSAPADAAHPFFWAPFVLFGG
jgi:CHAT domain-containing protein